MRETCLMTFGEWISGQMVRKGLKGVECARRAKMSPQQWSNIVNDHSRRNNDLPSRIQPDTLRRIAAAIETPLPEVLAAAGYLPEPPAFAAILFDDEAGAATAVDMQGVVIPVPLEILQREVLDISQKLDAVLKLLSEKTDKQEETDKSG